MLLPREEKQQLALAIAEKIRRTAAAPERWARSYQGSPVEFIGELMGPTWYGEDWAAWRVFVKSVFGQRLTKSELDVFRRCTGRAEPPTGPYREVWAPVGRRGGKSRVLAMIACYLACCFDYQRYLAPGEVGYIVVLADKRVHAHAIMNFVKGALTHRRLQALVKKPLVETIELSGRVTIEVETASIAAVRSRTVIAALNDEIAFWPTDEACANPDEEILAGLRPAMVTIPNSIQLSASSKYARRGALWNAYEREWGRSEDALVWLAETELMHPSIDREFLRREYERDPVAAAAEYGLEWRTDVAAYVEADLVAALTPRGVSEMQPLHRVQYTAFVDPSGGAADSFALAIAHQDDEGRAILDRVVEHRAPFSPEVVVEQLCAELSRWRVTRVTGDRYGGEWPSEQFEKRGVVYEPSELSKSDIYREFMPVLTARRCQLLDVPRLRQQLLGLERRTHRGGRDSIDHAPGGHDDLINAAAGALVACATDPLAIWRKLGQA